MIESVLLFHWYIHIEVNLIKKSLKINIKIALYAAIVLGELGNRKYIEGSLHKNFGFT